MTVYSAVFITREKLLVSLPGAGFFNLVSSVKLSLVAGDWKAEVALGLFCL